MYVRDQACRRRPSLAIIKFSICLNQQPPKVDENLEKSVKVDGFFQRPKLGATTKPLLTKY